MGSKSLRVIAGEPFKWVVEKGGIWTIVYKNMMRFPPFPPFEHFFVKFPPFQPFEHFIVILLSFCHFVVILSFLCHFLSFCHFIVILSFYCYFLPKEIYNGGKRGNLDYSLIRG